MADKYAEKTQDAFSVLRQTRKLRQPVPGWYSRGPVRAGPKRIARLDALRESNPEAWEVAIGAWHPRYDEP